ncbi:hypothetical protein [Myxococcus sp. CA040A]|uniref:hypothetical protein n=1 Tax=Myxococcus sp. CA040A TaxID=2741738 RepID=UPI00157AAED2|nr:hypothetical protein [Myxococcus sp. CA040A]NTX08920.1 hypothetical protein [Myxococcus sp. CA040A]
MTTPVLEELGRLRSLILGHRFRCTGEAQLQAALEQVLTQACLSFRREVVLGDAGRIDFMVGHLGVEVKVDGSISAVTRQLLDYAEREEVHGLLLITTRSHHDGLPALMRGKPVRVAVLRGGLL